MVIYPGHGEMSCYWNAEAQKLGINEFDYPPEN